MIITLILAIGAVAIALARGGSLERLAATKFRWPWLVVLGLGVQIAVDVWSPRWLDDGTGVIVLLVSNAFVAAFLVANARLPGVAFAAIGMLLNVIVIAANGAMPVARGALETAGYGSDISDLGNKHEFLGDETVLPWLADVIPIPLLRSVISLGDVALAIGIAQLVYTRTRIAPQPKHRAAPPKKVS